MRRTGGIVIGKTVNETYARTALKNGGNIHYRFAVHLFQRYDLQSGDGLLDLWSKVRLNGPDHNILAAFVTPAALIDHSKTLTNAGSVAYKNFEAASRCRL